MEELIKCTSHLEDGDTVEHDDNEAGKVGESEEGVDYEKMAATLSCFSGGLNRNVCQVGKVSYSTRTYCYVSVHYISLHSFFSAIPCLRQKTGE